MPRVMWDDARFVYTLFFVLFMISCTDSNKQESINSDSLKVLNECKVEPYLASEIAEIPVQFERLGYFIRDSKSSKESLVFNRTVALRDTWKQ